MTPPKHDATAIKFAPNDRSRIRPALRSFAAAVAVLCCAASAFAQAENASSTPTTVAAPPATTSEANATSESDPVYGLVKPEDGTFLPLPPGANYAEFLEWAAARRGSGYGINSVSITGQASDETRIELDAEIVIMVRRPEAVRVVLDFREAKLTSVEHSGAGDESYEPFSPETGHAWSLQGRGEHRLRLKMLVPLTRLVDSTQLQLTTPANAAVTKLDLQVPAGSDVVAQDGVVRSVTETETGMTVNWVGTGGKLDLNWLPRPVTADPVDLASSCTIIPSISNKTVQLRAKLNVTSAKGRIAVLRVVLPDGFSLIDVTGKPTIRSFKEEMMGDDRVALITLEGPTEGVVETTLRVSAPLPADGRVSLNGFRLHDVPLDSQSGVVAIERSTAYDINVVGHSEGVEQLEMVAPGPLADSTAYEFEVQPFDVDLQIEAIPTALTVSPDFILQVSPERLDLDARFAVTVDDGDVRELRIGWNTTGWTIPRVGLGPVQEFRRGNGSSLPIDISVSAATSSFVIPMRASRPYEGEKLDIPLPRLELTGTMASIRPTETVIGLLHPENVVVDIDAAEELQLLTDSTRTAALPKPGANEQLTLYSAPAGLKSVRLNVRRLSREVQVSGYVSARPRGDLLVVEERFDYDVRYDTISEVMMTVPKSLSAGQIEFRDGSGRQLTSEVVDTDDGGSETLRIPLDRAMIGAFSITARYETPYVAADDAASDLPMPLLLPADRPLDSIELRLSRLPNHSATITGKGWTRLQSTENVGRDRWTASRVDASPVMRLQPRPEGDAKDFSISRMLLRTVVERDGTIRTVADCRFERAPELLAIRFPEGLEPEWFRWQGRSITPDLVQDGSGLMAELDLSRGSGSPVLTIAYHEIGDGPIGLAASRSIQVPQFSNTLDVQHTVWRITLPESQHLFSLPDGYEAGFRWGLHRGFWSRRTEEPFQQIGTWFGDELTALGPEFDTGHQYTFSRHGSASILTMTSMSRSLAVLFGAGAAIVLGYLFASGLVPRHRSVLIGIGAVLLLLWAFFPSQLQIFVQPALFGLGLVGIAVFAEWMLRLRQEKLSAESPSGVDFVTITPGEGSTSVPPVSIGSEDPTVLRTMRPSESSIPQDSGYGPATRPESQPQTSARD